MTTDELEHLNQLVHRVDAACKLARQAKLALLDNDREMVHKLLTRIERMAL